MADCTCPGCSHKSGLEILQAVVPHGFAPTAPQVLHEHVADPLAIHLNGLVLYMGLAPLVEHARVKE
eukprot:5204602-Amphidinium_carterae.1